MGNFDGTKPIFNVSLRRTVYEYMPGRGAF